MGAGPYNKKRKSNEREQNNYIARQIPFKLYAHAKFEERGRRGYQKGAGGRQVY